MPLSVVFDDHRNEVLQAFFNATNRALETCGLVAEGYAKEKCPADTGALRNSITHEVDQHEKAAIIGTNMKYGPYVELGTGQYYPGGRDEPWVYQDGDGNWHTTRGNPAQPFLKPAVANHANEYRRILEDELKK